MKNRRQQKGNEKVGGKPLVGSNARRTGRNGNLDSEWVKGDNVGEQGEMFVAEEKKAAVEGNCDMAEEWGGTAEEEGNKEEQETVVDKEEGHRGKGDNTGKKG
jgi:hypothetical protein